MSVWYSRRIIGLFVYVVRTGFEPALGDTFATAHSDANFS